MFSAEPVARILIILVVPQVRERVVVNVACVGGRRPRKQREFEKVLQQIPFHECMISDLYDSGQARVVDACAVDYIVIAVIRSVAICAAM